MRISRFFELAIIAALSLCLCAEDTAIQLFREAQKAEKDGQVVRAYLLYAQAAAKDPKNMIYWAKAQALRPAASMSQPHLGPPRSGESTDEKSDKPDIDKSIFGSISEWDIVDAARHPLPPPELKAAPDLKDFDLRGDSKTVWEQVGKAFNLLVAFDSTYQPVQNIKFQVTHLDYLQAIRALQDATSSFVVPVADRLILVANDTTQKRTELDSMVSVVIPIPDPVNVQDIAEIAAGIRGMFDIRRMAVDTQRHAIVMRDYTWKVRAAQMLLHDLMRAKPQVAIDIEFLAADKSKTKTWGLDLPTSFPLVNFGNLLPGFPKNLLSSVPSGFSTFLTFGGGATFMGLGLTNATLFATAADSISTTLLHSEVVTSDGQPVSFHAGEQFPIQSGSYLATPTPGATITTVPPPQFTFEDLGLVLKITPHVHGIDQMTLEISAEYKLLGATSINGIPIISERKFESKVRLANGEWAVLAGLVDDEDVKSFSGIPGLVAIPFLRKNTRTQSHSETMIVFKPHLLNIPPTEDPTHTDWIGTETRPRSL